MRKIQKIRNQLIKSNSNKQLRTRLKEVKSEKPEERQLFSGFTRTGARLTKCPCNSGKLLKDCDCSSI